VGWGYISLIDPTVLVSYTKNLLVEWGVGSPLTSLKIPCSLSQILGLLGLVSLFGLFGYILVSIIAVTALAMRL